MPGVEDRTEQDGVQSDGIGATNEILNFRNALRAAASPGDAACAQVKLDANVERTDRQPTQT